jgi:hypothetical protein
MCGAPDYVEQVWSVVIFKNSIVLHDIDQLTSTFIHL